MSKQQRKVNFQCYPFKAQWSEDYFVTELDSRALYLWYNDTTVVLNKYNINWRYQIKHSEYSHLSGWQHSENLESKKQYVSS